MRSLPTSWNKTLTQLGFKRKRRRVAKVCIGSIHYTRLGVESMEARLMLSATQLDLSSAAPQIDLIHRYSAALVAEKNDSVLAPSLQAAIEHLSTSSSDLSLNPPSTLASLTATNPFETGRAKANDAGQIQVVVEASEWSNEIVSLLTESGMSIDAAHSNSHKIQGWASPLVFDQLAAVNLVESIALPDYAISRIGNSLTEGDAILNADDVRTQFAALNVDGSGVTVGVISTGVDHWTNVAATGDLPNTITIDPQRPGLSSNDPNVNDDEGTAMLEIVHDLAPGANLFFSGPQTSLEMVDSINWLVNQGVDIIVDDLGFFSEPFFEDGPVAQAARNATNSGVVYVSAAGNEAQNHYQSRYTLGNVSPPGGNWHRFGTNDDFMNVTVPAFGTLEIYLQWSDPFGASANDYQLVLFDTGFNSVAVSVDPQTGTQDPTEFVSVTNNSPFAGNLLIGVDRTPGAAVRELEMFVFGDSFREHRVLGDSIFGHPAVEDVISVAAIDASDPGNDDVKAFSSQGPSTIYTDFTTQDSIPLNSLDGAGIDGVQTEVGSSGLWTLPGGAPSNPFFGTSAAAPHIAGLAALLLDAKPTASVDEVTTALHSSAIDIGTNDYDHISGFGRFEAFGAMEDIHVWHNTAFPTDVDNSGLVSPVDAINVINVLLDGTGSNLLEFADEDIQLVDVNRDNRATPTDAIRVINDLLGLSSGASSQALLAAAMNGELVQTSFTSVDLSGTPASDILVGQEFFVDISLTDLQSPSDPGIFSASLDLTFNDNVAQFVGLESSNLQHLFSPIVTAGNIMGIGGLLPDGELFGSNVSIRLRFQSVGTGALDLGASSSSLNDGIIITGQNSPLDASEIYFDVSEIVIWDLPKVVGVQVSNAARVAAGTEAPYTIPFGTPDQLLSVPIAGADTVSIAFNQPMDLGDGSGLEIVGINSTAQQGLTFIGFDSATNLGTWQVSSGGFSTDRMRMELWDTVTSAATGAQLDGEWQNPASPDDPPGNPPAESGDGIESGNFVFTFVITPADGNQDGVVDSSDYQIWVDNFGSGTTVQTGDYNGDGIADAADYTVWRDNFSNSSVAIIPGDYNRNGSVEAADYYVWRDNLGSTTNLDADGSTNGVVDLADYEVWRMNFGGTTNSIAGDYSDNLVVDTEDYDIWKSTFGSTTDLRADGNDNGIVDAADYTIWRDTFGATAGSAVPLVQQTSAAGLPYEIPGQAPYVTAAAVSGSASAHPEFDFTIVDGSGEQLRTVPVAGVDTLTLRFSEEVRLEGDELSLVEVNGGLVPNLDDFSYDMDSITGTWQFDAALAPGQYLLALGDEVIDLDWEALDGEYNNPWTFTASMGTSSTFPSGDGEAGGDFRFRFTILDADYNGDNVADTADFTVWADNNGLVGATSTRQGDGDGNGVVDSADYDFWTSQFGNYFAVWPSIEPGAILVSTLTDEDDGDHSLGDLSLREALGIAAANSGHDRIEFQQGLTGGTLTLGLGELSVASDVTIAGLGVDQLTLSGADLNRIFNVASGAMVSISDMTLADGNAGAGNYGGAIYSTGDLLLDSVAIVNGTALFGGGLYQSNGSIELSKVSIAGNSATWIAGAVYLAYTNAVIDRTTISGNSTYVVGGIYVNNSDVEFVNSTISTNTASSGVGGGVYLYTNSTNRTAKFSNVTVTSNDAGSGSGGGVYVSGTTVDVTLNNTIIAGNTSNQGADDVIGTFNIASSFNLIGAIDGSTNLDSATTLSGTRTAPLDPMLSELANYGGPTLTHTLLVGSQAIDAGDDLLALGADGSPLAIDQHGSNRLVNAVDIGAVERELLGDYNRNGLVDTSDFTVWRDHLGSTINLVADGDGNGKVDQNDYQVWNDHFGNTVDGTPLSAAYGVQVVSTATDENDGDTTSGNQSLREALAGAAVATGNDVIVFRRELEGQTIALDSQLGELTADSNVSVVGPGKDLLTVSGGNATRVLNVSGGKTVSLSNITLADGSTTSYGGAIHSAGEFTLSDVDIRDSQAGTGGGVYQASGSLALYRSSVIGNTASFAGGGLAVMSADSLEIDGSTIAYNEANYVGGLWLNSTEANLTNATISTNTANNGFGGGAYLYAAQPKSVSFTNVTIANNSGGSGLGGGLYVAGNNVDVTLNNTIVASNTSNQGADDVIGTFNVASSFNLIGAIDGSTGLGGSSNLTGSRGAVLDAGLTVLGDHGGLTVTHALLEGSLAIDAGDDASATILGLSVDQRGKNRFDDGDDDTFDHIDIGAFELGADEYFGSLGA